MKNRLIISAALAFVPLLVCVPFAVAAPGDPTPGGSDIRPVATTSSTAPPTAQNADPSLLDPVPTVTDGSNYNGNPENEAALVASEDKRLVQVRSVSSIARWSGTKLNVPYRVASGTGYTLVLPARGTDYTIDDLLTLAPRTFVLQPDGSFLLSENIVVETGATLTLSRPTAFTIDLLSTAKKFVSIVNYGGKLNIAGTPGAPVKISSWDVDSGAPRQVTNSGRAYVRSIGGTVTITHAAFQNLGFWSGRTGGLSMTGTDRPITGALNNSGAKAKYTKPPVVPKKTRPVAPAQPAPAPAAPAPPPLAPGDTLLNPENPTPDFSYVSASIQDITVTDNVYGLFLANAVGISLHNAVIQNSRMDGIVLHRFVSNAVIMNSTVRASALNGFMVSRAASDIRLDTDTAESNHRDGIYIDGRALATGPSATGTALTTYGNNIVYNSTVTNNSRYGIEVRGGKNTMVRSNTVTGGQTGIVADASASAVTITGNHLSHQTIQGIALRDGVTASTVDNNTVAGSAVGIYLRNAEGKVEKNTLSGMTNHGISAIGAARIQINANTISGSGPSPVDLKRASNATSVNNTADNWNLTRTIWQTVVAFFQPLTIMWTLLALIVLFTAAAGHRHRGTVRHPYAAQAPMSTFTDLDALILRPELISTISIAASTEGAAGPGKRRRRAKKTQSEAAHPQPVEFEPVEAGLS